MTEGPNGIMLEEYSYTFKLALFGARTGRKVGKVALAVTGIVLAILATGYLSYWMGMSTGISADFVARWLTVAKWSAMATAASGILHLISMIIGMKNFPKEIHNGQ